MQRSKSAGGTHLSRFSPGRSPLSSARMVVYTSLSTTDEHQLVQRAEPVAGMHARRHDGQRVCSQAPVSCNPCMSAFLAIFKKKWARSEKVQSDDAMAQSKGKL